MTESVTGNLGCRRAWLLPFALCLLALLASCASETADEPSPTEQRSKDALKDPYNYSPFEDSQQSSSASPTRPGPSRISGGGIGELDRDGLRKDLDNVLNP